MTDPKDLYILPKCWQWQFLVKTKEKYGYNDFAAEYVPVTSFTNKYQEIIAALHDIPELHLINSANISLFREGVENKWEDPNNKEAHCIQIEIADGDLDNEEINWLFMLLTIATVKNTNEVVNGLYTKIKNAHAKKTFTFQLWVNGPDSDVDQFKTNIKQFLSSIQLKSGQFIGDSTQREEGKEFRGLTMSKLNDRKKFGTTAPKSYDQKGRDGQKRDSYNRSSQKRSYGRDDKPQNRSCNNSRFSKSSSEISSIRNNQ